MPDFIARQVPKYIHLTNALLLPLLAAIVFMAACNEPKFGTELQPDGDAVSLSQTDTLTLHTSIISQDSVLSENTLFNLCGTMHDPIFGLNKAGFYTQFRLLLNNINFSNVTQIDSFVLSLPYAGAYGEVRKFRGLQKFKVYELSDSIQRSKVYYSNHTIARFPQPIGQTGFIVPRLLDSVRVKNRMEAPQLRIKLSQELAQRFIAPENAGAFLNSSTFEAFFKGIYIESELQNNQPGQGGILYFDLLRGAKMVLYYNDTLETSFVITEVARKFNYFSKDYSTATFTLDTTLTSRPLGFVQATSGAITRIQIPHLDAFAQSGRKILINKAELEIHVDPSSIGIYDPIDRIQMLTRDADGNFIFITDHTNTVNDPTSPIYNPVSGTYRFLLTRHLQLMIDGRISNRNLFLVSRAGATTANRVQFFGHAASQKPMRLKLVYQFIN